MPVRKNKEWLWAKSAVISLLYRSPCHHHFTSNTVQCAHANHLAMCVPFLASPVHSTVLKAFFQCSLDKAKALSLILHCCDISHPSKEWRLHHRWTYLLMEEFFQQVSVLFLCTAKVNQLVAKEIKNVIPSIIGSVLSDIFDKLTLGFRRKAQSMACMVCSSK